jgi:hypothetical protein
VCVGCFLGSFTHALSLSALPRPPTQPQCTTPHAYTPTLSFSLLAISFLISRCDTLYIITLHSYFSARSSRDDKGHFRAISRRERQSDMRNMRSRESDSLDGHGPDIVPSLRLEISRASHPIGSASRSTTLSTIAGIWENDIERWQASAFTEATGGDEGIVARLLRSCIDSISHLLLSLKSASTCKHLRRSLAILKIWCDGHSVWKGKLDSMLERSKGLRHTTLSILNPLCKALTSGMSSIPYLARSCLRVRRHTQICWVRGLCYSPATYTKQSNIQPDQMALERDGRRH